MPIKKATRAPKKPATRPTVKRPATVKKSVRRPPVAAKPKVPNVKPLPPPPQIHATPLPPHVVAAMEAAKTAAAAAPTMTPAQRIWGEIKDLPIQMFGLPGQTVAMHATPIAIEPSKLYLTIRSSATLPSLEESIKAKYTVELVDRFVVVSPIPSPLVPHK
jgi:hypothetical protein